MKKSRVLLGIALVGGVILTAIIGNYFKLDKTTWSGWVQAIGSIAALGVAIFVMARQNRYAIDADRRALLQRANAVSAILDRANAQVPQVCAAISGAVTSGNQGILMSTMMAAKIKLAETQTAIRAIPGHELGSYEMVVALHMTLDVASTFEMTLGVWLQALPLPPSAMIADFMRMAVKESAEAKQMHTKGMEMLKTL